MIEQVLSDFLKQNSIITSLTIRAGEKPGYDNVVSTLSLNLLVNTLKIESFTFVGQIINPVTIDPIFAFIHSNIHLKLLTIRSQGFTNETAFKDFYAKIVSAIILRNTALSIQLVFRIGCKNKVEFLKWMGFVSQPLLGKGIFINGVVADDLVKDLLVSVDPGFSYSSLICMN